MAQVYYPKKSSTKLLEGAVAGLLGGVAFSIVMLLADVLTPDRSWWTSPSVVGSLLTGATNFNTDSPDIGSLLIGLLLTFLAFALIGMGFVNYMPLFRRFKINALLGGATYGLLIWLAVHLLFLNGLTGGKVNLIWLAIADVLAGVTIAWWLSRMSATGEAPAQPE